jgi:hypothetical protein
VIPAHIQDEHDRRCLEACTAYYTLPVEVRALLTVEAYIERYVNALPPLMWSGGTVA